MRFIVFFQLHKSIQLRLASSFLAISVGSMIFPFMAIYFSNYVGGVLAGILLLINTIISIITTLYGGYLSDRIGRKRILVFGEALIAISFAFMALANSPILSSVWLTFIMMLLNSFGNGLIRPASDAMLIDVSTPENRKLMYSVSYWITNLSVMIGSIIGGLFFKTHLFEMFLAITFISLIPFVIVTFFISESFKPNVETLKEKSVLTNLYISYKKIINDRVFMFFTYASILLYSIMNQITNYIAVRLDQEFPKMQINLWKLNDIYIDGLRMVSIINVENTIVVLVFSIMSIKLLKKYNADSIFYLGIILFVGGISIVTISKSFWVILVAALIFSIGELLYVPTRQALLADIVHEQARSSYMAMNSLSIQIGRISGSLGIILGAIIGSWGMSALYIVLGIATILLFKKSMRLYKYHKSKYELSNL
ncbi:MFS transporter [Virgibacillus pantothenticus]|uniref:MDR family MFS transporter n=1 Tax=Virgibacillus TaxID=84406 RepID=UPI000FFECB01|nr:MULTISPECIES: MFS transporter [Virgibacillus]MBS7427671.1 MFS transporter [Virgibacillus sp. 19R1-5]MBU8566158.1 MFS transporter [Virgibacillus pantothenticus]MBU8600546.1 MFS transporter [Virgibacillus pantothenticus]MBU8634478.1 MFS transporter [Virgibacillus pantothenticus]MBU8642685.1 MFS transporter [Virgibacillus pantothenticus]